MEPPAGDQRTNPPPLTAAASVVAVQGVVLVVLSVLEFANLNDERRSLGLSTAVFFAAYGLVLLGAAWGLHRRSGWSRGPVLITQLIFLGLAWNVREQLVITIALVICAGIVLAGMLHPDTIEALDGDPTARPSGDRPSGDQPSDSSD